MPEDPKQDILVVIREIAGSEFSRTLGLSDKNVSALIELLDFMVYVSINKRSLDFFAEMFMFHVHKFRNLPR